MPINASCRVDKATGKYCEREMGTERERERQREKGIYIDSAEPTTWAALFVCGLSNWSGILLKLL